MYLMQCAYVCGPIPPTNVLTFTAKLSSHNLENPPVARYDAGRVALQSDKNPPCRCRNNDNAATTASRPRGSERSTAAVSRRPCAERSVCLARLDPSRCSTSTSSAVQYSLLWVRDDYTAFGDAGGQDTTCVAGALEGTYYCTVLLYSRPDGRYKGPTTPGNGEAEGLTPSSAVANQQRTKETAVKGDGVRLSFGVLEESRNGHAPST